MPFTIYKEPLNSITEQLCNDILNICHGNPPSPNFMSYNLFTTTDFLLHEIALCFLGPGGGLTGVTGRLPIVIDNTIPSVPEVQLEVVRDTRANILALASLANGGSYTITDMPAPLQEATFTAFDNGANVVLQKFGTGTDALGNTFNVGYNITTNEIFDLYCNELNIRTTKEEGSAHTCIDNCDFSGTWKNCVFDNMDISNNTTGQNVIEDVVCKSNSIIEFFFNVGCSLIQGTMESASAVAFIQDCGVIHFSMGEGSTLTCDTAAGSILMYTQGRQVLMDTNGFNIQIAEIGDSFNIVLQATLQNANIQDGFNNVTLDLDAAANFGAGLLTVPATHNYAGIINLTNNAGGNILQIATPAIRFNVQYRCGNGVTNTFNTTPEAAPPVLNDIVGDFAAYIINGYGNNSDYIEILRGVSINEVKNYMINL